MKAVAMFLIVAHNFFHNIQPTSQENEFFFHLGSGVWQMLGIMAAMPGEALHALLAFFGHYGVQISVVLSGYGLTVKVLRKLEEERISARRFQTELSEPENPKRNLTEEKHDKKALHRAGRKASPDGASSEVTQFGPKTPKTPNYVKSQGESAQTLIMPSADARPG